MNTHPDLSADVDDLRQRADDAEWDAEGLEADVEDVHSEVIALGKQVAALHAYVTEESKMQAKTVQALNGLCDMFELLLAQIANAESPKDACKLASAKLLTFKTARVRGVGKVVTP